MRLVAVFCKEGTFAFFFFPPKVPCLRFSVRPKKKAGLYTMNDL